MDLAKLFLSQLLLAVVVCVLVAHASSSDSDYYKLLGVSKDASDKEIKRAFRKLAVKYHPDKNPDPEARKHFEKIANAYDVLSDPEKRRHYDTFGTEGPQASQYGSPFDYDAFFNTGGGTGGSFHFTFDNIFKDFFGEDDDAGFFQHFHHTHDNHHLDGRHSFFAFDTEQDSDDSLFSNPFGGGGFGDGFGNFHSFHSEAHSQGQAHRSCRTVTKQVGNTVTTYTTCS